MDSAQIEASPVAVADLSLVPQPQSERKLERESDKIPLQPAPATKSFLSLNHKSVRTSLRASTIDSIFAVIFTLSTSGIILNNFLVELGAGAMIFGALSAIPMVLHACQPIGAYFSERVSSRFTFAIWTHGIARILWMVLGIGVFLEQTGRIDANALINLTLAIVLCSSFLSSLGSPSWLSWMAMIVPRRLRGRYFGIRSSISSLTNLVCVPIAGYIVSHWYGGTRAGFGVVLGLGIICGIISLACQYFKRDINPQIQNSSQPPTKICKNQVENPEIGLKTNLEKTLETNLEKTTLENNSFQNIPHLSAETIQEPTSEPPLIQKILADSNFMTFLLYVGVWMFAVSLSNPFFQLYMLDTLSLDVGWVTIYTSVQAAATLVLMILWGRLADRIGNRSILFFVGICVAIVPLLWLGIGQTNLDLWLWLPLLHVFTGGTGAAIELCTNNLQLGVAPIQNQAKYFAIAAAVTGVCGACGTTLGGFIASHLTWGGLPLLFVISAAARMAALTPLLIIQEPHHLSLIDIMRKFFGGKVLTQVRDI